jgi:WD40 repeat protein
VRPGYNPHAVALLDLETKAAETLLAGPGGSVHNFVFDAEKNWLVAIVTQAKFSGWVFWNVEAPDQPLQYPTPEPCRAVAINPRRNQIAWAAGKTVRTMDMETGAEQSRIDLDQHVHFLRFSADGERLAISAGGVTVRDAATGAELYDLRGNATTKVPPAGRVIDFDDQGRIWATHGITVGGQTKQPLMRYSSDGKTAETIVPDLGSQALVGAAALSADRRFLALGQRRPSSSAETIAVWDLQAGKVHRQLGGHWSHIGSLAFSPDGRRLASIAQLGGAIKIWSLDEAGPQAVSAQASGGIPAARQ